MTIVKCTKCEDTGEYVYFCEQKKRDEVACCECQQEPETKDITANELALIENTLNEQRFSGYVICEQDIIDWLRLAEGNTYRNLITAIKKRKHRKRFPPSNVIKALKATIHKLEEQAKDDQQLIKIQRQGLDSAKETLEIVRRSMNT